MRGLINLSSLWSFTAIFQSAMALPSVTSDHANVNVAPIKGLRLVANGVEFAAGSEGYV